MSVLFDLPPWLLWMLPVLASLVWVFLVRWKLPPNPADPWDFTRAIRLLCVLAGVFFIWMVFFAVRYFSRS